ncbi:putative ribosomal protein L34Ae [Arabidopsis thaliana]
MIKLENSGIEDEEVSESPKLVFKFAFQTETFERLSREGYRSLSDDSGVESESSFLSSDSSPVIFTAAARKYETPSAKNLTFVLENPKAATFRVEDCFKETQEKTEDLGYSVFHGEDKVKTEDLGYSVSSGEERVKTEDYSVSSVKKKKIRFLTEEDFLESDSDFVDSSQTFTSNDEDGFLSDSDFAEASLKKGQNRKSDNSGSGSDSEEEEEEDTNGFESLWEHQDLIEQLKMEMKKVKAIGGLTTILEEEEEDDDCPKIMGDLKPWRIEEDKKFKHVDTIGEVHKFHRSYRERMRKLDILSFQKSYALGLLQSKSPQQATSTLGSNPSQTSFSSVFSVNGWLWKPKKSETEPMVQFIKEIQGELENVYVGQMCLSWEILHWQYEKTIELLESDVYGSRRYNEVAGEFQQFQVLLQRFLENEPFEEPRVQHYIKRRCVLRNLLQVPVIREDGNKDRKNGRRRDYEENDDGVIKSDQLVEIMEETIRLFWRFVRCDKLTISIHDQKSRTKSQIEPDHEEDSEDLEMFAEVKSQLQNKEKRLRDVLKSERCIIRRFQKHKEEDSTEDQVLHFFSQVDMKLVTRVLNMSKLTRDHLVWCHNKLTKINFVNRRLHLDPSFCLFPC